MCISIDNLRKTDSGARLADQVDMESKLVQREATLLVHSISSCGRYARVAYVCVFLTPEL